MGQKRVRGIPVYEDEVKRQRCIHLTDTAWEKVQVLAALLGISASRVIEGLLRKDEVIVAKWEEDD